ncbi:hypothetical protein [Saccharothrix longispora]|nr:hypothetical protein [Saccharothrix longispora]MDU0288621.1 hypothetical protein [Saccharothrix longispora]
MSPTPRQVVDEAIRLLPAHDMPGFADLWADHWSPRAAEGTGFAA